MWMVHLPHGQHCEPGPTGSWRFHLCQWCVCAMQYTWHHSVHVSSETDIIIPKKYNYDMWYFECACWDHTMYMYVHVYSSYWEQTCRLCIVRPCLQQGWYVYLKMFRFRSHIHQLKSHDLANYYLINKSTKVQNARRRINLCINIKRLLRWRPFTY